MSGMEPQGEGFIEVHHLYPISKYAGETTVNPSTDMIELCSNWHRMAHGNPERRLLSIEVLHQTVISNHII